MSGRWITNQQVEIYMTSIKQGYSQVTAAAKAGISERSARDIGHGKRINPKTKVRGLCPINCVNSFWVI